MHLTLGNKNYSSWSLRPWLLLKHFDIGFTEDVVPLCTTTTQQTLMSLSGSSKVPVLKDKAITVWDSLAICEHINDHYLNGKGWPEVSTMRSLARSYASEMHSGFTNLRNEMPMNCRAKGIKIKMTQGLENDIQRINELWSIENGSNRSEGWLFGEFSIVDCMFAPVAFRFETYGVSLNETATIYKNKLLQHTAMQEWLAQSNVEPYVIQKAELG